MVQREKDVLIYRNVIYALAETWLDIAFKCKDEWLNYDLAPTGYSGGPYVGGETAVAWATDPGSIRFFKQKAEEFDYSVQEV